MGNRVVCAFLAGVLLTGGAGCGKATSKEAAIEGKLAIKIAFTQAQSPDLLSQNNLTQLEAPVFDADQQSALVEQLNTVWAQCEIGFEAAGVPRNLELRTLSELRADPGAFESNRKTLTQRIGRESKTANQRYQNWFDTYSDLEVEGIHLASKLGSAPRTIPVLVVPHAGSIFPGSSFGQTFGTVDDNFMRSLFDGNFKVDSGARAFGKPLVISYGYEMNYQYLISNQQESFACAQSPGPGRYFNALAHEVGHFLGLSHTLPKCNLMHNDSNLITPEQCTNARKAAAML